MDDMHRDAVEGGNYDVIRDRLTGLGSRLQQAVGALDAQRQATFGSTELAIAGQGRVRTEHHCVPCDVARLGEHLLLGHNVQHGLKRTTTPEDVFSLWAFTRTDDGLALSAASDEATTALLGDAGFRREFDALYAYYKEARLIQLRVTETKLLAIFQVGATARDVKVLRWALDGGGAPTFIDARGERDHVFPRTHDFEWIETRRADHVLGRHPHVNVLDTVFVETVGGDLTIKVEDNTDDGEGIYAEPVDDPNQSLDDAEISYASLGPLVLLRIRPFQEEVVRHLVYNVQTRSVTRIDAIGASCVRLPEDHGIVFPGGTYLRTGQVKIFERDLTDMELVRTVPAPNGEDVLYVFHRRRDGLYLLYPYNLIRKEVGTPISAHGYSVFADGTLVVFRAADEPARVHPIQVWITPFVSAEHHSNTPSDGSVLGRIGNRDLVRGISDAYTLCQMTANQSPTREVYEELVRACQRFVDATYWLSEVPGDLREQVEQIRQTAERIIDEFEKVQALKAQALTVVQQASTTHDRQIALTNPDGLRDVAAFLGAMTSLRGHRGHLITLKETRYVDLEALDALEQATMAQFDRVSQATVAFLLGEGAFAPLFETLDGVERGVEEVRKASEVVPLTEDLDQVTEGVQLLGEVVAGLEVDDPTQKTTILEGISEVVGRANQVRAALEQRRTGLRTSEAEAEFGAQLTLFGQTVMAALATCDTPERCDEQLSRMLLQLEELEARFSDLDAFLTTLTDKRTEISDAFGARKQGLLEKRQRRVGQLTAATERILDGVVRRSARFDDEDALNSWFAADPMVLKLRQVAEQLAQLGDTVRSDEALGRLTAARQDALRGLRDKRDLFDDDALIRFGKHRFTVNTQPLQLTLVPHQADGATERGVALHLNGTDFLQPVTDPEFAQTRPYWEQTVVSEDPTTARAEYLAAMLLGAEDVVVDGPFDALVAQVQTRAADRYEEGYDRGLHDHDAARILQALHGLRAQAGRLRFGAEARSLAALFWAFAEDVPTRAWQAEALALGHLRAVLGAQDGAEALARRIGQALTEWSGAEARIALEAGRYLCEVLAQAEPCFVVSPEALALTEAAEAWLTERGDEAALSRHLEALGDWRSRLRVVEVWLGRFAAHSEHDSTWVAEAAAHRLVGDRLTVQAGSGSARTVVEGLRSTHPRIQGGALPLDLAEFSARLQRFRDQRVPGFQTYRQQRSALLDGATRELRIDELTPQVLTSFVRNRLVDEVYLPLIGDNLAKQMGAAGADARTDRMGLLLLVSPPGYGKTTLMEYVASRLGLTFVKVNGPALGHQVTSLDPAEAPSATSRQEVDKINLALEMGNNVMLYLDDIQHCSPELLQKFISLCDAQRRIEGVWNGRTRTYDLRGKKFAVVMAGNPYTETGERFQIPDMLANRADTYNLGDILSGRQASFALSFIENALTSNPVLAPLATRSMNDVYLLVRRAQGEIIDSGDLTHDVSGAELADVDAVLKHLFVCRDVLLKVNACYIQSAAMEDAFRTEPRFQLQGSYRNMNKLAEKVVPAMNAAEIAALITDHYTSEAQTLTTGAEANLLKLAELRGTLTEAQSERWDAIRQEFRRQQLVGGSDDDPATRITGVLSSMAEALKGLGNVQLPSPAVTVEAPHVEVTSPAPDLSELVDVLRSLAADSAATNGHAVKPEPDQRALVRQVLSVIELLTVRMVAAARGKLPEESHAAFVEDLKREVAAAVSELPPES
ncbi:MAG: DNA repair ATPase [Myxococcales bacterium]|nr:DNA repair ATPase [Myxococcales bacterium]